MRSIYGLASSIHISGTLAVLVIWAWSWYGCRRFCGRINEDFPESEKKLLLDVFSKDIVCTPYPLPSWDHSLTIEPLIPQCQLTLALINGRDNFFCKAYANKYQILGIRWLFVTYYQHQHRSTGRHNITLYKDYFYSSFYYTNDKHHYPGFYIYVMTYSTCLGNISFTSIKLPILLDLCHPPLDQLHIFFSILVTYLGAISF